MTKEDLLIQVKSIKDVQVEYRDLQERFTLQKDQIASFVTEADTKSANH